MNSVQYNPKVIVTFGLGSCILIFVVYTSYIKSDSGAGVSNSQHTAMWGSTHYKPLPPEIKEAAKSVKVLEKTADLDLNGKKQAVFYREVEAGGTMRGTFPVVLLHGQAFTSQNWVDVGTLQLIGAMGFRGIAVDLPGYGNSKEVQITDKPDFLSKLFTELKVGHLILVSPSMSGSFALPYILNGKHCTHKLSAYIPIAPVGTGTFPQEKYADCNIPVMIVTGSNDMNLGKTSKENLGHFSNSKQFDIEGAGHACYMDKPDEWHKLLYGFVDKVEGDLQKMFNKYKVKGET